MSTKEIHPLAAELSEPALQRLLRYVVIDTQADPDSDSQPSSAKQLELSRLLVDELRALGIGDADLDEHGYVMATIPATAAHSVPAIGLIAHVDTSFDVTGANVRPQVIRGYVGGDIELPGAPSKPLRPDDMPELKEHVGHDLVTTDGTTLLGADDKAGVAEIMAAAEYLVAHPDIEHGPVRIAFTCDEEIGRGIRHFDLERFGARAAYTVDGSTAGELDVETFSAMGVTIKISGYSVHPGTAKGRLVNAVKIAADLVAALPRDRLSPETTEKMEGFVHPVHIVGSAEDATITFIVRDFDRDLLERHVESLRSLAAEHMEKEPRARIEVEASLQYLNMKEYLDKDPVVVERAVEAYRRVGLEAKRTSVRGGTDGSLLSAQGLPTPNIFTGGHEYHSVREWVCVQDMGLAAATLVNLVQVWAEEERPKTPN